MTIDRQCASGLMAIATAAKQIIVDGFDIAVGGGVESISLVQNEHFADQYRSRDPWFAEHQPDLYMPMLKTAEVVAARYGVSREVQDEYSYQSQMRTAAAQEAGRFDDEIVPLPSVKLVQDKETKEISEVETVLEHDEGNRPSTTLEGLAGLNPVLPPGTTPTTRRSPPATLHSCPTALRPPSSCPQKKHPAVGLSPWASTAALRLPVWTRTKWASGRSTPCPNCSNSTV